MRGTGAWQSLALGKRAAGGGKVVPQCGGAEQIHDTSVRTTQDAVIPLR